MKIGRCLLISAVILIIAEGTQLLSKSAARSGSGRRPRRNDQGSDFVVEYAARPDYGNAACMKWTGEECQESGEICTSGEHPSKCFSGRCFCPLGWCVNEHGGCSPHQRGEALGRHVVRFVTPYEPGRAYLGLAGTSIAATSSSQAAGSQWNVVRTSGGSVRLENLGNPGYLLALYDNRRDHDHFELEIALAETRSTAASKHVGSSQNPFRASKQMSMDGGSAVPHIWPALMPIDDSPPLEATFKVIKDANGLHLWNEHHELFLSVADPEWWPHQKTDGRHHGIIECKPESLWSDIGCGEHTLLNFNPPLPPRALVFGSRSEEFQAKIIKISLVVGLGLAFILGCFCLGKTRYQNM
eukprot:TRINITY_DN24366_c0_g1_i1.p1 TRINITY_DN24366_c0_g1~~TRINITY_DN24366_c0_g1_i1.p1  ORF type:complete len:356 (-),score=31.44 TRINITY_DN24366_c0_g1_i1:191-1258(-)